MYIVHVLHHMHMYVLTFDTLYGVDHDGHSSRGESLEALLGVDVHPGEPAPEARVRVVPADHHLGTARLLEHVQHLSLEDWVYCFDTDALRGGREEVKKLQKIQSPAED